MALLKEGIKAPDFELKDQDGKKVRLADFKGKKLVIYFYPKDDTPGCTAEACNIRDNYTELISKGIQVVGISPDDGNSHTKFVAKYKLPFTLLSDPDHIVLELYGAWGEKNNYGKKYFGVLRTTYIVSENGMIEKVIPKVDTADHTKQILNALNL
jgi:thioredoxin-dependent peroxiredoxin